MEPMTPADVPAQNDSGPPILRSGATCWRLAPASRLSVIVDAADYFAAARNAMLQAEHAIYLIGWDFNLRIELVPDAQDGIPSELGPFLKYLVRRKPHLRIHILKWDMAVLYSAGSQLLPMLAMDLRSVGRIDMRFDSQHPWTAAHHQKVVVIDDSLAFCGGIDMTVDRWDTRAHLPHDERRRRPDGRLCGPWHDATAVLDGDAARALADLCRARWKAATGQRLPARGGYRSLWPDGVEPQFRDIHVGIARTMPAFHGRPAVHEIEDLYLAAIRAARRTIYLESQYFASASLCQAIAERLTEPDGPEVVVVNPLSAKGWLEEYAMGSERAMRLGAIARADRHGRFGIFYPVDAAEDPIYVHAKILIVDDRLLRIGSSNVNNRSMGFDTECDLAIEPARSDQQETITAIRDDLLAEHLGEARETVRQTIAAQGSVLAAVHRLRRDRGRSLRPLHVDHVNALEKFVTNAQLADPERPEKVETILTHLAKRVALRVPPTAWALAALAATGTAFAMSRRHYLQHHGEQERS